MFGWLALASARASRRRRSRPPASELVAWIYLIATARSSDAAPTLRGVADALGGAGAASSHGDRGSDEISPWRSTVQQHPQAGQRTRAPSGPTRYQGSANRLEQLGHPMITECPRGSWFIA